MNDIFRSVLVRLGIIAAPDYISRLVSDHPVSEDIEQGFIYVVGGVGYQKWAYLRCPSGNGDIIQLSLMSSRRPHWRVTSDWLGRPTIDPSVRQLEGSYAHFWIRKGNVRWCIDSGRPSESGLDPRNPRQDYFGSS